MDSALLTFCNKLFNKIVWQYYDNELPKIKATLEKLLIDTQIKGNVLYKLEGNKLLVHPRPSS